MNSGFSHFKRPDDVNWSEHGAVADLSTGRRFKKVQDVPNKVLIDEASSTITYIGETKPGIATSEAYWRIKKISISGTVTTIGFAGGSDEFVNVWDNRASLSYS